MQARHIAILGSGIMGSSAALALASCGARVTLFEAAERPFQGASRWNEGKIHLGYLYAADPELETARHILPGGLEFKRLIERHIGRPIDSVVTTHDDTYLVHRASVTSVAAMEKYIRDVDALLNGHPQAHDYLVDLTGRRSRRLSAVELDRQYDTKEIVAGFYVPERSVSTLWIADQLVQAVEVEPNIELALNTRVESVRATEDSLQGPFHIDTDCGSSGPYDLVINCLWEGRPIVDAALGILPPAPWSHRFRLALFLRTAQPISVPSTVIATGPFGDIKQYGERDFYLSWYPAGLRAEGTALAPPPVPQIEAGGQDIIEEIFRELGAIIPGVKLLRDKAETMQLNGGWVYACGQGPLSHPGSTLHRRHHTNIHRAGSYISIDTGKYSIAPWLAQRVAAAICG